MRLTKKQAIKISKELWTWLKETGSGGKWDWPGWKKYGVMEGGCALCLYDTRNMVEKDCDACPYYEKFGRCYGGGTPYLNWYDAKTKKDRKKYAGEFLEQLNQL